MRKINRCVFGNVSPPVALSLQTTFSLASSRESNPAEVTVKGCLEAPRFTSRSITVELRVETSGRVVGGAGRFGVVRSRAWQLKNLAG
jgi:hypothetical protein